MRIRHLIAVLGVVLAYTALFDAPARGEDCGEVKKKSLDKWYNTPREAALSESKSRTRARDQPRCSAECVDGSIAKMLTANPILGGLRPGQRASVSFHLIATDAGHHYLRVSSNVFVGRIRGEKGYAVRAAEDPLVLMFEGGGEMQLFPACDLSSTMGTDKRVQYLCGFYNVSRAQLEELSGDKLSGIKQFFLAPEDEHFEHKRLEHTEDGRSYFNFTWTVEANKPSELIRQSRCMLGSE